MCLIGWGHVATSRPGRARKVLVAAVILVVVGVSLTVLTAGSVPRSAAALLPVRPGGGRSAPRLDLVGRFGRGQLCRNRRAPGFGVVGGQRGAVVVDGRRRFHRVGRATLPSGVVGQSARVEANGTIDLTIGDGKLEPVLSKLTFLAASVGGFVSSSQAQTGSGRIEGTGTGTVVLRVPESTFGTVVTQVQLLGRPTSVTTTATDVTGQYVDLQARINALEASRQQYLTIMSHASSIGDILAVQSQIDTPAEPDRTASGSAQRLCNNETTYGTLSVSLSETGHAPTPPPVARPSSGLAGRGAPRSMGFVSGFEWLLRIAGPTLLRPALPGCIGPCSVGGGLAGPPVAGCCERRESGIAGWPAGSI